MIVQVYTVILLGLYLNGVLTAKSEMIKMNILLNVLLLTPLIGRVFGWW